MKFFKLALVLICFALFVLACSQNAANQNTPNTAANKTDPQNANTNALVVNTNANQTVPAGNELASAKKIFSEKCILCHKENGEGGNVDIEGDKFKVPSFKDPKIAALDDKKYTRVIQEGDDKMPSFKNKLQAEEISGLIKFIRQEFQGK